MSQKLQLKYSVAFERFITEVSNSSRNTSNYFSKDVGYKFGLIVAALSTEECEYIEEGDFFWRIWVVYEYVNTDFLTQEST